MRTAFFFFLHTLYFETRRGSHSNPLRIDICKNYYRININGKKSGLFHHCFYSWKSALKSHALRNGFCGIAVAAWRMGSHGGREQIRLEGVPAMSKNVALQVKEKYQQKKDGNQVVTCPHCKAWTGKLKRLPKHAASFICRARRCG